MKLISKIYLSYSRLISFTACYTSQGVISSTVFHPAHISVQDNVTIIQYCSLKLDKIETWNRNNCCCKKSEENCYSSKIWVHCCTAKARWPGWTLVRKSRICCLSIIIPSQTQNKLNDTDNIGCFYMVFHINASIIQIKQSLASDKISWSQLGTGQQWASHVNMVNVCSKSKPTIMIPSDSESWTDVRSVNNNITDCTHSICSGSSDTSLAMTQKIAIFRIYFYTCFIFVSIPRFFITPSFMSWIKQCTLSSMN